MKAPVLMVHGMSCTGEVWGQFKSFFESRDVRVYTPTLRPELRVSIRERRPPRGLRELGLADYVGDLELEARRIHEETGRAPAVIGHSMGGLLAQCLAERDCVSAVVAISPAAAAGVRTATTRAFWTAYALANRWGLTPPALRASAAVVNSQVLNALPAAERAAALDSMVWESGRAFADFAHWPVDETKIYVPMLTVAAGLDRLIPAAVVRLTGKKFASVGGEFREYNRHGHWLYSEPGWEIAAGEILEWLSEATERPSTRPPAYGTQASAGANAQRI
jgi:pimeloyl-ACP methyl ester carboxylesterase